MTGKPSPKLVAARPAESSGVAGAAGLLIGRALGVDDPDTLVAMGAVLLFLPAAVTWLVNLIRS